MKITSNVGAIFELQSFNTKLGIQSGPGDLLVEKFNTFSIHVAPPVPLPILN